VLDGTVYSAPVIQNKLGSDNRITGRFSTQEADELSKILKAGALPASLKYLQQLTVGASLGRDSIRDGVRASIAAMAFITIFMLVYYRLSGRERDRGARRQPADRAGGDGLLRRHAHAARHRRHHPHRRRRRRHQRAGVRAHPRGAAHGKTVRAAVANGFDRVWITILDTHATALIAAAFLFQFGTGPIKGFAVTLVIGLIANVFASYFVSKFLFEWVLGGRHYEKLSI
jgi:preprotein translocase subunit SecD